jgi:proline iminopeptidase
MTDSIDLTNVKASPINKTRKQLRNYPALRLLPQADFKITITYGERDIYGESKKYVRERYPTAVIHTIANCGHLSALQCKTKFVELLDSHYYANRETKKLSSF